VRPPMSPRLLGESEVRARLGVWPPARLSGCGRGLEAEGGEGEAARRGRGGRPEARARAREPRCKAGAAACRGDAAGGGTCRVRARAERGTAHGAPGGLSVCPS